MSNLKPTVTFEQLLALIRGRRSIRRFIERPIPDKILHDLLEAARWAPSAHNRQPWRFVVLTAPAARRQLATAMAAQLRADLTADGVSAQVIEADAQRSETRLSTAAALIVVCLSMRDMAPYHDARRQFLEREMAVQSAAMAGQNILLAAHAHSLGAVWMCAPLFCPEVVREVLELPEDFEPQGIIAVGYPAEVRHKEREPLETRVIFK